MRHVKRQTSNNSDVVTLKPKQTLGALEQYLNNCPNHADRYEFATSLEAYDYGHKLREIAMKEEGVTSAENLKKFEIDIVYQSVKLRLVEESSVSEE